MLKQYFDRFSWTDFVLRVFQVVVIITLIIGVINSIGAGKYTNEQWVTLIFAGLAQGSIYALIALGYTLVYGILLMINFAHGDIYMAGGFTAVFFANSFAASGFLAANPVLALFILMLIAASVSMVLNVVVERVAYRPLRGAPRLVPLITAIGASFAIEYTFRGFYGAEFHSYPTVPALDGKEVFIGGFGVPSVQLVVLVAAVLLMIALYYFIEKTKIGKAMRAVSEDKEVARLMGIDVDRTIMVTFAVGGALAGAAGVFNGLFRPQGVFFFMGFIPGIKAFTAAVLGGIGNIPGAMFGGLFLGILESVGPNLILEGLGIPAVNQLRDAFAFSLLVLILIFRPQGIFGERLSETKV